MKARTFSTAVLVGTIAILAWFNCYLPLYIIGALFCLAALWEFYRMVEFKRVVTFKKMSMTFATALLVLNYPGVIPLSNNGGTLFGANEMVTGLFVISVLGFIALKEVKINSLATAATTIFGFLYVPYLFSFLLRMANSSDGLLAALYLVAVTKSTDIGAYLVGSWIGKHKMSPQTSPKKTWEGFCGGVLVSLTVSVLYAHFVLQQLWPFSLWHAAVLGILLPVACVVGDLAESVLKRDTEIKDSGTFIPGIGGALDLIDSILFTAPLFYYYVILFGRL
ncbi:MAG: phosphatidate cytidylyltransferase [Verrucomicrobiales bacterium]|jgi:phosphatidate cytidylyltransferase|nr:phosphatidate cytidylyltransferase [Verrucomicrobiales bacterium]